MIGALLTLTWIQVNNAKQSKIEANCQQQADADNHVKESRLKARLEAGRVGYAEDLRG